MSQSNDDLEKYRGTAGAEIKTANIADDDHALSNLVDEGGTKERVYDAQQAGARFVNFYDDAAAAIREYLSNSETACIRRGRHELLDAGFTSDEIPNEVSEMLDMAKEECDYEPLIEVHYNRKADAIRLVIEDNGIGISSDEYQVVQHVGYSTSHDEGSQLGNFGIGWMSGFQLTSVNGMFKMSTKSYLTDESYSTAEYVANFEMLSGGPDEYGTRFEFPAFGEAAKQIDIPAKVAEFADGMTIPVLYRDFDSSGQETSRSDDYLPTRMENDYPDDSLVIVYEDEFFKAVMSPDRKENGRGQTTYNISMPIRRNCDEWGSEPKFDAPWKWDFRAKQENGPIVHCESDASLVGLVPKEDTKYDRLLPELQEDCVPMGQVPDDAIIMPEPASSRDSFMSGHDDFWRYASRKLNEKWADVAAERFEGLDSWDDFLDMSREEKNGLFRAYSAFGPDYKDADPDTIQETLEDNLGVTLDKDLGKKLHESKSKVRVVRRGSNQAHTKGATTSKQIWKVIDEAPDGIYMGKTISQKRADIVWGLGETHIVRLEDKDYDEMENDWNWEKAKELPSRKLGEKLPELDDDIIEKYENTNANQSNNTKDYASTGGNGQDPTTYRTKVRVGVQSNRYFTRWKVDNLAEKLEDGETFKAGSYECEYLLVFDDDTTARQAGRASDKSKGIAATTVPEYVYNYLKGKQNVYESKDELYEDNAGVDITLSDDTEKNLTELPETDCLIIAGRKTRQEFRDDPAELVDLLGYDSNEFDRFSFVGRKEFKGAWKCETDATVIKTGDAGKVYDFEDYSYHSEEYRDLLFERDLPDMDEDSEEYEALFAYRYGEPDDDTLKTLIEIAEKAGLGN